MGKHTPGPWIHTEVDEHYHGISAGCGYHVDDADIGFDMQGCISAHDAALIAAAPDLLEALGLCLVQLEKEHMPSDEVMHAMHHARAAICKAVQSPRGEA